MCLWCFSTSSAKPLLVRLVLGVCCGVVTVTVDSFASEGVDSCIYDKLAWKPSTLFFRPIDTIFSSKSFSSKLFYPLEISSVGCSANIFLELWVYDTFSLLSLLRDPNLLKVTSSSCCSSIISMVLFLFILFIFYLFDEMLSCVTTGLSVGVYVSNPV